MTRYEELLVTDFNNPYREFINTYVQTEELEDHISYFVLVMF